MRLKLERIIRAWQSLKSCNLSFPLSICNLFPLQNYRPIYVISYIQGLFGYRLLLKIENWKHYSKIIFKGVNSAVEPNFKEKFAKISTCGSCEQYKEPTQKKHGTAQTQTHLYQTCTQLKLILLWISNMLKSFNSFEFFVKCKTCGIYLILCGLYGFF